MKTLSRDSTYFLSMHPFRLFIVPSILASVCMYCWCWGYLRFSIVYNDEYGIVFILSKVRVQNKRTFFENVQLTRYVVIRLRVFK